MNKKVEYEIFLKITLSLIVSFSSLCSYAMHQASYEYLDNVAMLVNSRNSDRLDSKKIFTGKEFNTYIQGKYVLVKNKGGLENFSSVNAYTITQGINEITSVKKVCTHKGCFWVKRTKKEPMEFDPNRNVGFKFQTLSCFSKTGLDRYQTNGWVRLASIPDDAQVSRTNNGFISDRLDFVDPDSGFQVKTLDAEYYLKPQNRLALTQFFSVESALQLEGEARQIAVRNALNFFARNFVKSLKSNNFESGSVIPMIMNIGQIYANYIRSLEISGMDPDDIAETDLYKAFLEIYKLTSQFRNNCPATVPDKWFDDYGYVLEHVAKRKGIELATKECIDLMEWFFLLRIEKNMDQFGSIGGFQFDVNKLTSAGLESKKIPVATVALQTTLGSNLSPTFSALAGTAELLQLSNTSSQAGNYNYEVPLTSNATAAKLVVDTLGSSSNPYSIWIVKAVKPLLTNIPGAN